jgi:hypothetical protein
MEILTGMYTDLENFQEKRKSKTPRKSRKSIVFPEI